MAFDIFEQLFYGSGIFWMILSGFVFFLVG